VRFPSSEGRGGIEAVRSISHEGGHNRSMVIRPGIGATAASAAIFSILLISNLALFVSSEGRAKLYSKSDAVDSISDNAMVLAGTGGIVLLDKLQSSLGSRVFTCSSAGSEVVGIIGSLSTAQRTRNLSSYVTAAVAKDATSSDGILMMAPFDGSVVGALDISLRILVAGGYAPLGVSYDRTETHLVHLPVRLGSGIALCEGAIRTIGGLLSASIPSNCTTAAIGPIMGAARRGPAYSAALAGFSFGLAYEVHAEKHCSVDYTVSIEQNGISGPAGPFSVRLQEESSISFQRVGVPPQA
jgi:hypothetical protein